MLVEDHDDDDETVEVVTSICLLISTKMRIKNCTYVHSDCSLDKLSKKKRAIATTASPIIIIRINNKTNNNKK